MPVDLAEEIVFRFFRRSFLSLWTYANPQGKDRGKELCDTLVVCDPDVVIVSVKAPTRIESGDAARNLDRWRKRAIDESHKQIYGAERWVRRAPSAIRSDGSQGLPLPRASERRIHRVAVAVGGRRQVPLESRDFGRGFVHVFDEPSLTAVLTELDTVTDFVGYLTAKEQLYRRGVLPAFAGGEEDLLALYLHKGREFLLPTTGKVLLSDTLWDDFIRKDEYQAKKREDRVSYAWDGLINGIAADVLEGRTEFGSLLSDSEITLRVMAKEDRFARRMLAASFMEFLDQSHEIRSRMTVSQSGVVYVFLAAPHGADRRFRVAELGNRCFVARGKAQGQTQVVGIATEQYEQGRGFSLDVCYLEKDTWTTADQEHMEANAEGSRLFHRAADFERARRRMSEGLIGGRELRGRRDRGGERLVTRDRRAPLYQVRGIGILNALFRQEARYYWDREPVSLGS